MGGAGEAEAVRGEMDSEAARGTMKPGVAGKVPVSRPGRSVQATRRFRRAGVRFALGAAAVVAVVAVMAAALPSSLPFGGRAPQVPIGRVAREPFVRRVPAQGYLRAVRSTQVSAPVAEGAFHVAWIAPDGSRVRAGQVVVRFDSTDADKQLAEALADLESARLKAGKESAQSLGEIEKLQRDAEVARVEARNATQFQKKDGMVFSRHDIITSDIDQTLAREREKHAEGAQRTRRQLARTDLDLLQIQIRKADLKIQRARTMLAALAAAAPRDGVLVLERDFKGDPLRIGDTVWSGQPLGEIPDLAEMQAEVYVLEADAGGLAPGKPATMTVESDTATSYDARIRRVDSLAKPRVRGSPVQYFAVTLALSRTDPRVMKPGQRVQAMLLLDARREALVVPRQSIFLRDGRTVVYRAGPGGGFQPVEVKVGPSGMGKSVIESGVAAGDLIALRDPTRAGEGAGPGAGEEKPGAGGGGPAAPGPAAAPGGSDEG
jgi:HlyD family secretion protein